MKDMPKSVEVILMKQHLNLKTSETNMLQDLKRENVFLIEKQNDSVF